MIRAVGFNPVESPIEMEVVTDPRQLSGARRRAELFERNWSWYQAHAAEVLAKNRGRCVCISGEQVFTADTPAEALALAKAAHPEDEGRFTRIIPQERTLKI